MKLYFGVVVLCALLFSGALGAPKETDRVLNHGSDGMKPQLNVTSNEDNKDLSNATYHRNEPQPIPPTSNITTPVPSSTTLSTPTTPSTTKEPTAPSTTKEPITTPPTTKEPSTTTTKEPITTQSTTKEPTTPPTTKEPITTPSTTKEPTTAAPSPKSTTVEPAPSSRNRFDGPSFIGGIVLSLGLVAIGFIGFKYYKARSDRNYRTL